MQQGKYLPKHFPWMWRAGMALGVAGSLVWILLHPSAGEARRTHARVIEAYGSLPLRFEANEGQTDEPVRFLARGSGYTLFLTTTEAVLALRKPPALAAEKPGRRADSSLASEGVLRLKLIGANPAPSIVGLDALPGHSNYFVGGDAKRWNTEISQFARVKYEEIYPGIDLVFYGAQRQLEYDFIVAPGADPEAITLGFQGAVELGLDLDGDLLLRTASGPIRLHKPVLYQEVDGVRRGIAGAYVLKDQRRVGFRAGDYDAARPLVIDPVLSYSSYLGGSGDEEGHGVAVDATGNAYVLGFTASANFPTASGAFSSAFGGLNDVFLTKMDPTGSTLVYSTYLGGNGDDVTSYNLVVDASGNAYVTGRTSSTDFPTTPGAFQTVLKGINNAFVTKIDPSGSALIYSTYLGGSGDDMGRGIAVDASGNAYVMGRTDSANFPTTAGAFQTALGGLTDTFVAKLDATGSNLVYSTYLGGSGDDFGYTIAEVDSSSNAYVTGFTTSADFPTTAGAFQPASGGLTDAYVTKVNPTGSALVYSTYLGGSSDDFGYDIAVDASGNAYVTGQTNSGNFPTAGAFRVALSGLSDVFVTKMNPSGSALVYSTYLGGGGDEFSRGIAVDASGSAYVTGQTTSPDFPVTADAFQSAWSGLSDVFVTKMNPSGSALVYSTYLGGGGDELGRDIALDASGNAYVTGQTTSADFPTTAGAKQTARGGLGDVFVAKIAGLGPSAADDGAACFVATAAFGSPLAAEIQILREFRERYLLSNAPGRVMVAAYARLSPPLADLIRPHEGARAATRALLRPVVWWAHLTVAAPGTTFAVSGGGFAAGLLLLVLWSRARWKGSQSTLPSRNAKVSANFPIPGNASSAR